MRNALVLTTLLFTTSYALAVDTWVQTYVNQTDELVITSATPDGTELQNLGSGVWSLNITRYLQKKIVTGAATQAPAWHPDVDIITNTNQFKSINNSSISAPNGLTVSMMYTKRITDQTFRLYEDGTPVRDFAVRHGDENVDYSLYYTINP